MRRLILADDNKTIQKVVQLSFDSEEIEVACFSSGAAALEHLRGLGGDIVLADVDLSPLDGYELCRNIKQDPATSSVPVVLLANTFKPFDIERANRVGSNGSLTKPFETAQLVKLVEELVQQSSARPSSEEDPHATGRSSFQSTGETSPISGDEGRDLILTLPGPSGLERSFLKLSIEQCCSPVKFPERVTLKPEPESVTAEQGVEPSGISDEEMQVLVDQVMQRLSGALKELVPQIARDILKD